MRCKQSTGIMVLDRVWLNYGYLEMRGAMFINRTFQKCPERQGMSLLADENGFNFVCCFDFLLYFTGVFCFVCFFFDV